ncbi:MAG: copper resistance protein CopC [Gemmatimonadales bacterium]
MIRRPSVRHLCLLAGLFALPLLTAARPSAFFHLHLKRAEPGINDTIAVAPKAIRLWFTETPEAAVAGIALIGPGGAKISLGKPALESGQSPALTAPVQGPMAPGAYRVQWRAMAGDGHPMRGSFGFILRAPSR